MIVTCDHCGARYRLDESKIPGRGARVTCPSCRHVFVVYRREAAEEAAPAVVAPPRPVAPARPSVEEEAAGLDVNTLDFRSVGIGSWKVKVKIGLIYDFNDYKTFNKNVRDGRVTASDLISFDGSDWSPIGDLSALSQRFCEVYVRAQRAEEEAEDEVGEDEPTRIMSASDVDIPAAKKSIVPPAEPVGPSVAVGAGEPAASGGLDSSLADAFADAAAEVDGGEDWKSGGRDSNQPPRFVDPFEKKKAQGASGGGSPRRPTSRTPPPKPADAEGGGSGLMIAAALLGVILLGGGYWFMTRNSNAEVTTTPDPAPIEAPVDGASGTNPDEIRDNLIERIEQNAEPVEDVEPEPGYDENGFPIEQELIPVVPEEFRNGSGGSDLEQNGSMTVGGGEGASSHAAAGDAAAQGANWSTAAASYQKAVELEPSNSRYLSKLCEYRYRSGNVSSARSSCSQAKQYGASAASKWLGHISYDQGDMPGAVGHYQSYLSSNPPDRNEIQRRIDSINGG